MEARHLSHKLLPCCRQFWGKVCGQGECTALIRHCAAKLQMLMQMEGGAILWTYHKMGLQGQESPRLDARVGSQSSHLFSAYPPPIKIQDQTYPHAKPNYGAKTQHATAEDTPPPPQQVGKKFYPRRVRSLPFSSHMKLTVAYFPHSAPWRPNRQTQRKERWHYVSNFWITWHCRTKQYSPTKQATWPWWSTATPPIYPNQRHAAMWADTCSWQGETTYQQIMGPT